MKRIITSMFAVLFLTLAMSSVPAHAGDGGHGRGLQALHAPVYSNLHYGGHRAYYTYPIVHRPYGWYAPRAYVYRRAPYYNSYYPYYRYRPGVNFGFTVGHAAPYPYWVYP